MARLLADEDVAFPVVEWLRHLGHDVMTVHDLGQANLGVGDDVVLELARNDARALVTMNRKHFKRLHRADSNHAGIIICTVDLDFNGLASRIDDAVQSQPSLAGQLVRVYRLSTLGGA
jgi:predicted nuclease of predicted toxin-antitoxin system